VVGRSSDGHSRGQAVRRGAKVWACLSHTFIKAEDDEGHSAPRATPDRMLLRVDVAEWKDVSILETFPGDTESGTTLTGLRTSRPWPSDDHVTSYVQATFLNTSLTDKFAER
jgi:hypothetical protein